MKRFPRVRRRAGEEWALLFNRFAVAGVQYRSGGWRRSGYAMLPLGGGESVGLADQSGFLVFARLDGDNRGRPFLRQRLDNLFAALSGGICHACDARDCDGGSGGVSGGMLGRG